MATKYQVFVSSTYEDLVGERDQVIKAVLEMGHIPVGMEMFSAADEEQWKIITKHIDESDYYAVIVAHRYGSTTGGISYTRKEYEYALSKGIPVLGFIIDSTAAWPADRIDKSDDKKAQLEEFKAIVKQKPVAFWSTADDLYGRFSVALTKAITANPRDGWVRSSAVAGPEVMAELTRLSAENASLRAQVQEAIRDADSQREAELARLDQQLMAAKVRFSFRYRSGDRNWVKSEPLEHGLVFDLLGPSLLVEASVTDTAKFMALNCRPEDETRATDIVAVNQIQAMFSDWLALDLVEPSTRKHSVNDTEEYWSLTETGVELMKRNRRLTWARRVNSSERADPEAQATVDAPTEEIPDQEAATQGGPAAKKTMAKKTTAKKTTAKKTTAKKTTAKKTTAKKTTAKKTTADG